jgi:hypothetical protein
LTRPAAISMSPVEVDVQPVERQHLRAPQPTQQQPDTGPQPQVRLGVPGLPTAIISARSQRSRWGACPALRLAGASSCFGRSAVFA